MSRIADVPALTQRDAEVTAVLYNLSRRAKLHFGTPIRISLPAFPGFTMVVEDYVWVCVDERQNDLPVLAWVDFEDEGRDALHVPVKCKLNFYHFAASKVRAYALDFMLENLELRLHEDNIKLS